MTAQEAMALGQAVSEGVAAGLAEELDIAMAKACGIEPDAPPEDAPSFVGPCGTPGCYCQVPGGWPRENMCPDCRDTPGRDPACYCVCPPPFGPT